MADDFNASIFDIFSTIQSKLSGPWLVFFVWIQTILQFELDNVLLALAHLLVQSLEG